MQTLAAIYQLCRLAWVTGFRFRGAYWTWRLQTAYGRGYPTKGRMLRDVLEYARWVHRMRRG